MCETNAVQVSAYDPIDHTKVLNYVLLSHSLFFSPTGDVKQRGVLRYRVTVKPIAGVDETSMTDDEWQQWKDTKLVYMHPENRFGLDFFDLEGSLADYGAQLEAEIRTLVQQLLLVFDQFTNGR